mmetsp:Transcript_20716/g.61259  ORF Transcript_20716/g.61259 Transcript_20716/m.61259 type:complete len:296 (-) Transcript_20716:481-1368(-)
MHALAEVLLVEARDTRVNSAAHVAEDGLELVTLRRGQLRLQGSAEPPRNSVARDKCGDADNAEAQRHRLVPDEGTSVLCKLECGPSGWPFAEVAEFEKRKGHSGGGPGEGGSEDAHRSPRLAAIPLLPPRLGLQDRLHGGLQGDHVLARAVQGGLHVVADGALQVRAELAQVVWGRLPAAAPRAACLPAAAATPGAAPAAGATAVAAPGPQTPGQVGRARAESAESSVVRGQDGGRPVRRRRPAALGRAHAVGEGREGRVPGAEPRRRLGVWHKETGQLVQRHVHPARKRLRELH